MATAAELIAQARHSARLTQAQLAQRARTSQAAVARYEAGVVSPSVATLERIVRAAGGRLQLGIELAPAADLASAQATRVRRHRSEVLAACRKVGARNVRIFGSVARGTPRPDSDIDLLVDFDSSAGLLPLVDLREQLTALLGYQIDVVPLDMLRDEVAAHALADAVPV